MKDDLDNLKVAQLIWWVSMATLPLYLLICHVLGAKLALGDKGPVSVIEIRTAFFVVTIWLFACMNVFRSNRANNGGSNEPVAGGDGGSGKKAVQVLRGYPGMILISMALSEGIALMGLFLCMLGDSQQMAYLFVAIAAMAIIIFRPNLNECEKYQNTRAVN